MRGRGRRLILCFQLIALFISKCSSFASVKVATGVVKSPYHYHHHHRSYRQFALLQQQLAKSSTQIAVDPSAAATAAIWGSAAALALSKTGLEEHQAIILKEEKKKKTKRKVVEYEIRKQQWLERYGSLQALQRTFGSRKGDLSPEQTRRLYHTLLPRSLLGLYEMGLMKPEELAPLAYEARIAAKQYARSRCVWYARVATEVFDHYRNVRDRGRWGGQSSMTWDEIWSKYEAQIVQEECTAVLNDNDKKKKNKEGKIKKLNDKELTMRIYLRILEKSTATNKAFDAMFLKSANTTTGGGNVKRKNRGSDDTTTPAAEATSSPTSNSEMDQLTQMGQQLDDDVRTILLKPKDSQKALKQAAKLEIKQMKEQLKAEEREQKQQAKLEKQKKKELERKQKEEEDRLKKERKRAEKMAKQLLKQQKKRKGGVDVDVVERDDDSTVDTDDETYSEEEEEEDDDDLDMNMELPPSKTSVADQERWQILKIMAGTRYRFRLLNEEGKLNNNEE